jgi:hypothetical protein
VKHALARQHRLLFPMLRWPNVWRCQLQRFCNRQRVLTLLLERFRGFVIRIDARQNDALPVFTGFLR